MTDPHPDHDRHDHDRGLTFDRGVLHRRRVLQLAGMGALAALAGCAKGSDSASTSTTAASGSGSTATGAVSSGAACATPIAEETAGPYPGDGSNGPDVLARDGVVRRDITTSFDGASGVAEGIPLEIELDLTDVTADCAALPGAAVYLWCCDREGRYSMYSEGVTDENYLRGVQEADDAGTVRFTSTFPGCYPGRWPHLHFEVYESVDAAIGDGSPIATSQLAFPPDACEAAYATEGYEDSRSNLAELSLETDGIFRDSADTQTGTMSGSVDDGYTVALAVPVDPSSESNGSSGMGGDPGGM